MSVSPNQTNAKLSGRVLLVDDNHVNRMVIKAYLSENHFIVDEAEDGLAAVQAFAEHNYQLVLMDCQMPNMDGFSATAEIRRIEAEADLPACPIVALTALADEDDKTRCLKAGMSDYLSKPVDQAQLYRVLQKFLDQRQQVDTTPSTQDAAKTDGAAVDIDIERVKSVYSILGDTLNVLWTQFDVGVEDSIDRLERALGDQDRDSLKLQLHSLRGICGNLALTGLAQVCQGMENRVFQASFVELQTLLQGVKEKLKSSSAELGRQLDILREEDRDSGDQASA